MKASEQLRVSRNVRQRSRSLFSWTGQGPFRVPRRSFPLCIPENRDESIQNLMAYFKAFAFVKMKGSIIPVGYIDKLVMNIMLGVEPFL